MTLASMVFPWRIHAIFDVLAGVGLAMVGAPRLALLWAAGLCAVDWFTQKSYRHWLPLAAEMDSAKGLRRLSWIVLARTILWFAAPLAYTIQSHSQGSFGFVAVTAISITALG